MYPGMVNSPITELAAAIDETQTTIEVIDGTKLPDAPNLAIIGLGEDAETILYTEKTGNILSGVTRGFQGVAKAWGQGARIARFFTEYDQRAMMQNIQENADNLAAHLNDFAQVWNNRIVEMGSNANGTYVRWENGLQMCWRVFVGVLDPNDVSVDTWIHPAAFIETPAKFIGSGTGSANIHYQTVGINTTTGVSDPTKTEVVRRNLGSSSPISVVAYVLAIGRWK